MERWVWVGDEGVGGLKLRRIGWVFPLFSFFFSSFFSKKIMFLMIEVSHERPVTLFNSKLDEM